MANGSNREDIERIFGDTLEWISSLIKKIDLITTKVSNKGLKDEDH